MTPTVYVETSIVSYLAAQPSRDLITAAHQQIAYDWWRRRRSAFDLFVSQLVIDEAAALPVRAGADALHIAIAAVHRVDYLLVICPDGGLGRGSESFVTTTREKLGFRAKGRGFVGGDGCYVLREPPAPYNSILGDENDVLSPENRFFWKNNLNISSE